MQSSQRVCAGARGEAATGAAAGARGALPRRDARRSVVRERSRKGSTRPRRRACDEAHSVRRVCVCVVAMAGAHGVLMKADDLTLTPELTKLTRQARYVHSLAALRASRGG
jgi:hypothetical protein